MRFGVPALCAALLLGACDPDATILEVDGQAVAADRVELVIAGSACGSGCTVTGPSGAPAKPVFLRDGLARTQATTDSGIARFQLEAPDASAAQVIDKLIVVGWKGDQAVGFAKVESLPLDQPGIFQVALDKLTQQRALNVWTNDDAAPTSAQFACVTANAGTSSSLTIVPAEDPDCDGFTGAQECPGGDHVYRYTQPVKLDDMTQANCAHDGAFASGTASAACRLGGTGCTDGMTDIPPDAACQVSKFCVPEAVCQACPTLDTDCLRANILADVNHTPLDMTVACPIDQDDAATPCASTPALDLPAPVANAECDDVAFLAIDPGNANGGGNFSFDHDLQWPGGPQGAPKLVQIGMQGCAVQFMIEDTAENLDPQGTAVFRALARYQLTNGYVAVVPLTVTYRNIGPACPVIDPGTTSDPACTVAIPVADHGLAACFTTDVPP